MAKQEEIREDAIIITKDQLWREGIRDEQRLAIGATLIVDGIFHRLNEKGVVIKVERELPTRPWDYFGDKLERAEYEHTQEQMLKAGYVAVEPLIKEVKQ